MANTIHLVILYFLAFILFCACPPFGFGMIYVIKEVKQRQWEEYVSGKHRKK